MVIIYNLPLRMISEKINVQLWHLLDNSSEIGDYQIEFTSHEKYICTNQITERDNSKNSKLNLTCSYCNCKLNYEIKSINNQKKDEKKLNLFRFIVMLILELILFELLVEFYEGLFYISDFSLTNIKVQIMIFILILFLLPNFIISNFILILLQATIPYFDYFSKPVNYSKKDIPINHKFIFSYGYP